jgi:threonine dehydrogenase-like Zn-dependent dehydrogenase
MQAVLEALASGSLKADNLITSRIVLQDLFEEGLESLRKNPAQVKILVDLEATEKRRLEDQTK